MVGAVTVFAGSRKAFSVLPGCMRLLLEERNMEERRMQMTSEESN